MGLEAVEGLNDTRPDAVFLDIELPDMNGFEILSRLSKALKPKIIITTVHQEYAIKAFEVTAIDYLIKPYSQDRLTQTLTRLKTLVNSVMMTKPIQIQLEELTSAIRHLQQDPAYELLPIKSSGKIYMLPLKQIEYIEASGYYIEIYLQGKKHLLRESLTTFGEHLDPRHFIRIHRGVTVNIHFIQEVEKVNQNDYQVKLKNQKSFRISKTYLKPLFDLLQIK